MTASEPEVRLADLLAVVREHLVRFELPEPLGVQVRSYPLVDCALASFHLAEHDLSEVAGVLLAWVDTLSGVSLSVWRPPSSDSVHIELSGRLADSPVEVWSGVQAAALLACLEPGQRRTERLGLLRTWTTAGGQSTAGTRTGGAA